jgi:ribonuclease Y
MQVLLALALAAAGIATGWLLKWIKAKIQLVSAENSASRKVDEVREETELLREQMMAEGNAQLVDDRELLDEEIRERSEELKNMEAQLNQRTSLVQERESSLEKMRTAVSNRQKRISEYETTMSSIKEQFRKKLEDISGSTREVLKEQLIQNMANEEKRNAQHIISRAEEEIQRVAETRAREIIVSAMQRLALPQMIEHSPTNLESPSPENIENLLSREGRYIRMLESRLNVELSVEDSEEALNLSSPDPINREMARATLDRLFREGRMNPQKIEETVRQIKREVHETMRSEANSVVHDLGLKKLHREEIEAVGRLLYRYSYGQNNLYHSKEVALLAAMIARDLNCDAAIAKRGGLLHDIGKGFALDGKAHVELGVELAEKWGEDPLVVNAIASHHDDAEQSCSESVIVQIADAISGARPGARRETISDYLERVENLERIAEEFEGVDKAFAIYAGRELRVVANSDKVDDESAVTLASGIAKKIEENLKYPGKIKVTVIREMKASSYTH